MERSDCHQFMVAPPRQYRYDEGQFTRHQLVMAGDQQQDPAGAPGRGAGGERKRRFTEEQVRSLETTFHERRAKLEPREKAALARELGLQPRQVAIWFQNKRARWRSKQLEHDYAALRAQYDALHACVESLKEEKVALAAQLDELRGRLNERQADQSVSSKVNGAEAADDKRNSIGSRSLQVQVQVQEQEQEQDQGDGATPAVDASEDSAVTEYYDRVAYEGLPDHFCAATPDLWDTWPLLEWNAVA